MNSGQMRNEGKQRLEQCARTVTPVLSHLPKWANFPLFPTFPHFFPLAQAEKSEKNFVPVF
jgi:hypothetical protein